MEEALMWVVPEPSTLLALAAAGSALFLRRKRT
ncbi:MAG: hypothetical protein KatS3mg015_1629 [Fimbriimonadales bacterium]|nr:MAG: hypothetical protein KatS3mg015_1629 [Fimbriimonadales bacterium]